MEKFQSIKGLYSHFCKNKEKKILKILIENYSANSILELLNLLTNLNVKNLQNELEQIQKFQDNLGAGFHGFVPDTFDGTINLKQNRGNLTILENAKKLLELRSKIEENIKSAEFPLNFQKKHKKLKLVDKIETKISRININIDLRAIELLLNILENPTSSKEFIDDLIELKTMNEMLNHRKNLGFIPEPIMDKKNLKKVLEKATENSNIIQLWIWLSPWNFFNIADYQQNFSDYKALLDYLRKNLDDITRLVKAKLEKYISTSFTFSDTFGITFEWGIRGWVTEEMAGCNLEFFKDNIEKLIQTITHELYHRIQLKVFQRKYNKKNIRDIEELIVKRDIGDKKNNKFYEALAFIFAEGTATFVSGVKGKVLDSKNIEEGINLLHSIYMTIFEESDLEKAEDLINKGMISNGPFYSLGYYISKKNVEYYGDKNYFPNLIESVIKFFKLYLNMCDELKTTKPKYRFNKNLQTKIDYLQEKMKNSI